MRTDTVPVAGVLSFASCNPNHARDAHVCSVYPFSLKDVTLRNRIAVPPMCQYSATDGLANDWHRLHYPAMARGGAGLVIVEATAVAPEGRITPACLGLWNDAQAAALAGIAADIAAAGAVPGIQIGHAGRKASANRPWEGDDHIAAGDPRSWQTIAPSAIAYGGGLPRVPQAMSVADIARVKQDFVTAARLALQAGFKWLELHFAHGYLAQSFSRHTATSAAISTVAALPTGRAFCWKPWPRCARYVGTIAADRPFRRDRIRRQGRGNPGRVHRAGPADA
jgi:hypothetical protein